MQTLTGSRQALREATLLWPRLSHDTTLTDVDLGARDEKGQLFSSPFKPRNALI